MDAKTNLMNILRELTVHAGSIDAGELNRYTAEIAAAQRIFAAGAGRSGLVMRAFAMRLMHLGKEVYVLGDATTPGARPGDLLLIGSGSGETPSLVAAARKAAACGLRIGLNTIDRQSTLAQMADVVVQLPGASQKVKDDQKRVSSLQPMGSSYEQLSLLLYDGVILALMEKLNRSNDEMFTLHANLE